MVKTTRKQREALFKVFRRDFPNHTTPRMRHAGRKCPHCGEWSSRDMVKVASGNYRRFRKKVQPAFGDTCIMLPWKGVWLGIETDGYTHS
jgi:hypothetical protein